MPADARFAFLKNAAAGVVAGARALWIDRLSRTGVIVAFAILGLAETRLLISPTPIIPLLFNWTPSLPYHVAWLERGASVGRGDYVLYSFDGPAAAIYPGLRRQPFFKRVAGEAGDPVSVDGRNVYVRGEYVGFAKVRTSEGRSLSPVSAGVVPAGHLYVHGAGADSLDSRYVEGGFVPLDAVIGKVHPWF